MSNHPVKHKPARRKLGGFFIARNNSMNEPHSTATSGVFTYGLAGLSALLSQVTANDVLIWLSVALVVLRICYETHEYLQRQSDRKRLKGKARG